MFGNLPLDPPGSDGNIRLSVSWLNPPAFSLV